MVPARDRFRVIARNILPRTSSQLPFEPTLIAPQGSVIDRPPEASAGCLGLRGDGVAAKGLLQILKGRMHMSPRVLFRRVLVIAIGLSLFCGVLTQFRSDLVFAMAARPPVVGTPAPDFALPT